MRNTKKGKNDYNDDVESIHGSQSINSDRQRRANARADLGDKDSNGRKKNNLRTQIKKYGMRLETPTDDKGWIETNKSSEFMFAYCVLHILVLLNSSSYFAFNLR